MIRSLTFGVMMAAGLAATGHGRALGAGPTYHKDVAPILQKKCQDCHRPGQVAPFALLTYEQAKKRASDIDQVTSEKRMPPWPASTDFGGPFRDARVLEDGELGVVRDWVAAGCPEGDPKDAPAPRTFTSDWPLGPPDLILTMPQPYELAASGNDEFRVFILKTDLKEDRWIKAVDFKPGNRRVVHHVLSAVDSSRSARVLDEKDPRPGYSSVGGFGDGVRIEGFLPIWTPGAHPRLAPEGAGYLLPAGADVLMQMHYHPSGKAETDATQVGLYFSRTPLKREIRTGFVFPEITPAKMITIVAKSKAAQALGKRLSLDETLESVLILPPGDANHAVKGTTKSGMGQPMERDILVTSVMPHMHWLGKDFTFTAVLPDEKRTRVPLIKIDHWNFNWQGTYAFVEPVRLPAGTYFEVDAHFDNSASNLANPSHPPRWVHWGEQTTDEMCIGIFEFVVDDARPPARPKPKAPNPKTEARPSASR